MRRRSLEDRSMAGDRTALRGWLVSRQERSGGDSRTHEAVVQAPRPGSRLSSCDSGWALENRTENLAWGLSRWGPEMTRLRQAFAAIRNVFYSRPVCWRCWRPFSDWFVWEGWRYCYPCHDVDRIVILEPAAKRAPFYG